jgi:hypothetical protein
MKMGLAVGFLPFTEIEIKFSTIPSSICAQLRPSAVEFLQMELPWVFGCYPGCGGVIHWISGKDWDCGKIKARI